MNTRSDGQGTEGTWESSLIRTHVLVWISLFAALMAVGSYVHFPLGPVPVSLQVLFVLMAGFVLGPMGGISAVGLYILAGGVGLPVFYGGHGGLGHLLGPTGGYILGFVPAVLITGLGGRRTKGAKPLPWLRGVCTAVGAYAAIYALGLFWLRQALDIGWAKAAGLGMLPFLFSDVLQVAICISAVRYLQRYGLVPEL
jgi:biotin transport system substrate-specific component